jgi:uncharacterized protein
MLSEKKEMNGKNLYYGFLAGAHKILENQKELNKINVFPVPDADTGTNLASTVRSIIDNSRSYSSFKKTAKAIAGAALDGARGNSGVIFAQYLYGLSEEVCECSSVDSVEFAGSLKKAVKYMYEAIANPVEGTMITVIRSWSDYIYEKREQAGNFIKLMSEAYQIALKTLKETTGQLEALKKANTVDAGAKGIVYFLEGVLEFYTHKKFKKITRAAQDILNIEEVKESAHEEMKYRYCTEVLIKGENLNKAAVSESLKSSGDSLVIAGSKEKMRIHVHTDKPAEVFYQLRHFGNLVYQKADDMRKQYETAYQRKFPIALVTDSSCDLPQQVLDHYQINMVPISMFFGENHYLDKLTVSPDQFYDLLDESPSFPSTAQPNMKTFQNIYSHLATHYESVIAVHLSKEFSGTYQNSKKAGEMISSELLKKITVINSKTLSGSLGLIMLRIARSLEAGMGHEELVDYIEKWIKKTAIFVGVKTLKYMVRGGRVSPMAGWIANLFNLKPIVSMTSEGFSTVLDKAFSQKGSLKNILKHVSRAVSKGKVWEYCIMHAHNLDDALEYSGKLEEMIGKKPCYIVDISPVIGLNAGLGTVAVSLMME